MSIFYVNRELLEGLLQGRWPLVKMVAGFTNPQDMPDSLMLDITDSGAFLKGEKLPIDFKIEKFVGRVDFSLPLLNQLTDQPHHLESIDLLPITEHFCLKICHESLTKAN